LLQLSAPPGALLSPPWSQVLMVSPHLPTREQSSEIINLRLVHHQPGTNSSFSPKFYVRFLRLSCSYSPSSLNFRQLTSLKSLLLVPWSLSFAVLPFLGNFLLGPCFLLVDSPVLIAYDNATFLSPLGIFAFWPSPRVFLFELSGSPKAEFPPAC